MDREDRVSNRNIRIIAAYVDSKLSDFHTLFNALPYPENEYHSPEEFFLNEDEWTSLNNFERIFRRARNLVNEENFYFNCGASCARLKSWGRFHYFVRVFATPNDGFKRLPFFNKNFNDTKEIEIISPPAYESRSRSFRTILKIDLHSDIDPHKDYIRDPYFRGIISSIPTIWGLKPATIRQVLSPYNPEILFEKEPEFACHGLKAKINGNIMTVSVPGNDTPLKAGKKVILVPEEKNGKKVFLGKYDSLFEAADSRHGQRHEALLITKTVKSNNHVLLQKGDIYMAPYFILDVYYEKMTLFQRLSQLFRFREGTQDTGTELIDTINKLRKSIKAKNDAYQELKEVNTELLKAKEGLNNYAQELELRVEERTRELTKAKDELTNLNRGLEKKVSEQISQLERYNLLRRYLSPKISERILTGDHSFGRGSRRKMMTAVFTDIRGFSSLTDSLEPEEISQLLNNYLTEMIRIVHHFDGTLNKIIGDGILIFFGDPIPFKDHAQRAVKMAISMQEETVKLKDEWQRYGHELAVGIGINTGYMTVGNIGSDAHLDYTVIGNQVNVAARLESLAGPGQILISQRTYSRVKDLVTVEEMGEISVKGIHNGIKTYSVIW